MATTQNPVTTFLSDNDGNPSSMRLMALLALIMAAAFGLLAILRDSTTAFDLSLIWVAAAFTGKVAQKFGERPPCCDDVDEAAENPK